MTATDEQITAWLDGALAAEEASLMEALMDGSPVLAARAARLRHIDELVRRTVPLEDSLPAELLARLGLPAPAQPDAEPDNRAAVIDLAAARAVRAEARSAHVGWGGRRALLRITAFTGGWRVAAQLLLVLGLGVSAIHWLNRPASDPGPAPVDPAYHALADAPSLGAVANESANAVMLFAEPGDAAGARAIAASVGAQIVGEQTRGGVWRLKIDPAQRDRVLAELRGLPQVRMAEPIEGATP